LNDAFAKLGLGTIELAPQFKDVSYPKPTTGRVAHIDADFIAYQVSAETVDEMQGVKPRKSFEDMQSNAAAALEHLMRSAGATEYRAHITPSGSNKGGRNEQAIQQEYQGNRHGTDKARPEFLDAIRGYIGQELNGVIHLDQEADDGMAQANYNAMGPNGAWGSSNLSVIVSKDKDLRMVPGLHYDFDTETIITVGDPFGSIYIDDTKSTKTLKGWGTKFFWAQCLMGDTADHILGLPFMCGSIHTEYVPTAKYKKDLKDWIDAEPDNKRIPMLEKRLEEERSKLKKIGAVTAYDLLKNMQSNADCFNIVRNAFNGLAKEHDFRFAHWLTDEPVTPTQALLGDMQLLWMRRNKNPLDVVEWIKEWKT